MNTVTAYANRNRAILKAAREEARAYIDGKVDTLNRLGRLEALADRILDLAYEIDDDRVSRPFDRAFYAHNDVAVILGHAFDLRRLRMRQAEGETGLDPFVQNVQSRILSV